MSARGKERFLLAMILVAITLGTAACQREEAEAPPAVRKVRTITVEKPPEAADMIFTGHIEAKDSAALSFRIGGRMAERNVGVGATVTAGDVVARLDPENELNALRSARAALAAAQGLMRKAENQYQRQSHLLARNVTTRADFEIAEQARTAAQAQVDSAMARLQSAEDVVGFTVLTADAPGVVTEVGAEPGEVVTPGRMIVQLARRDGRDAVFEVPADVVRTLSPNMPMQVALASDQTVTAVGRVREVAPQADPVTRTFRVWVGLSDPPPAFRLGTTVSGMLRGNEASVLAIPSTALVQTGQETAVWVVDPQKLTVSLRKLDVLSTDPATALIGKGLVLGDIVVTAGASLLKDGQQVRLTGAETR
ncbi:efflux RND transporter periplasmic adaptor subunit [Chelatococcus asaccharovorans]|uniref:efflux RND transporter periplasmic adaptor subunit n=1 Tax=Chelatococcus asaccharovorans TaxID=28210 RepID=UPI00224C635B|nr:efflux RND transporter periplasmic adaptor subunit [Chelatococcus asaccharovorans]CAH1659099.1 RND family efflux transporter MFP subunit [Chelatococcus asaccharovorans]CAH1688172.1 RND family efflux transporter MFP subunit [Chelatococcus asaccharovorans]